MSKKPTKTKAAAPAAKPAAAAKTSKLKIALMVLAPLLAAGGGYGGWLVYAGGSGGDAAAEQAGVDATPVAAIPPDVAAESSFAYAFALSELLKTVCGAVKVPALKAAAEAEAHADGTLANLSWMAANRRLASITERSCGRMRAEIGNADAKAAALASEKDGKAKPRPAAH